MFEFELAFEFVFAFTFVFAARLLLEPLPVLLDVFVADAFTFVGVDVLDTAFTFDMFARFDVAFRFEFAFELVAASPHAIPIAPSARSDVSAITFFI